MNRDIPLLLARYVTRPIIVRLIALTLADDYAIVTRYIRDSYKYCVKYDIPINPKIDEFYIIVYDNKNKYNRYNKSHISDIYYIKSMFIYESDKLSITTAISNTNEYFTKLLYKYSNNIHVSYKYDRLVEFIYSGLLKYYNFTNCDYLYIVNILRINYTYVIFYNFNFKLHGYNNFSKYYKNGIRLISSQDGAVIVYYETGAIMLEFSYKPAAFYEKYEFIRDSLRIYSPLGTRLM
jgi:hypothetical protein